MPFKTSLRPGIPQAATFVDIILDVRNQISDFGYAVIASTADFPALFKHIKANIAAAYDNSVTTMR